MNRQSQHQRSLTATLTGSGSTQAASQLVSQIKRLLLAMLELFKETPKNDGRQFPNPALVICHHA
jgi:hypothetical protein